MTSENRIIDDLASNMYVVAGAGAGKTTALVSRVCALVVSGKFTIDKIAAITFTRASASELRYRIMQELDAKESQGGYSAEERERIKHARENIMLAPFQTIDSFCHSILQEHQTAAGVTPITSTEDDNLALNRQFSKDWRRWLERNLESDSELAQHIVRATELGMTSVTYNLEKTAQAVYDRYNLFADYAYRGHNEHSVDLVDMLKRSLQELERLLADYAGADADKLYIHIKERAIPALHKLIGAEKSSDLDYALNTADKIAYGYGRKENWHDKVAVAELLKETQELLDYELKTRRMEVTIKLLDNLVRFAEECAEDRRLKGTPNYNDTLFWTLDMLKKNPSIRQRLKETYGTILVDEYQDTNSPQIEILKLITSNDDAGGPERGSLFVVGDSKQAIYNFRGANPQTMADSQELFNLGDERVELKSNYRSLPEIVNWINTLFKDWFADYDGVEMLSATNHLDLQGSIQVSGINYAKGKNYMVKRQEYGKLLDMLSAESLAVGLVTQTQRTVVLSACSGEQELTQSELQGLIGAADSVVVNSQQAELTAQLEDFAKLLEKKNLTNEIERISSEEIAELAQKIGAGALSVRDHNGVRPSTLGDVCILVRKHSSTPSIESALRAKGVDYITRGSVDVFASSAVQGLVNLLEALVNPVDQLSLVGALKSELFGCSDMDLLKWSHADGEINYCETQTELAIKDAPAVANALKHIALFHQLSQTATVTTLLQNIVQKCRLVEKITLTRPLPEQELSTLRIFMEFAFSQRDAGMHGLVEFADLCREMRADNQKLTSPAGSGFGKLNAVSIMTIHAAKGLEFPIVIALPSSTSNNPDRVLSGSSVRVAKDFETQTYADELENGKSVAEEEEARVIYVALTRARDHLFLGLHRRREWLAEKMGIELPPDTATQFSVESGKTPQIDKPQTSGQPTSPSDRERWLRETQELIKERSLDPFVSPSKLDKPAGYDDEEFEILPTATTETTGMAIGSAVHEVLAQVELDASVADVEARVDQTLKESICDARENIVQMVMATLKHPLVQQAARSSAHFKELPIVCKLPSGQVLNAIIDLAFQDADGNWVVVDYKTDVVDASKGVEGLAEHYRSQLVAYAYALERTSGKKVISAQLVLCREALEGRQAEVKIDGLAESVAKFETTLQPVE